MSTLYELVNKAPDDGMLHLGFPVPMWRRFLEEIRAERPKHVLTTREAAEELGYSPATWKQWAAEGEIWTEKDGQRVEAWQDEEGGRWRLPYEALLAHLDRKREDHGRHRSKLHGPRKKKLTLAGDSV